MSERVRNVAALVNKFFEDAKVDRCHGFDHAAKVAQHGMQAAKCWDLDEDKTDAVIIACYAHDMDDRKFFADSVDFQNAKAMCREAVPELELLVIRMVSRVSCSKNGNTPDYESPWLLIPRWCDRIEALGEIGIWRCYVFSMENGRPLMVPGDRLPRTREELENLIDRERFEIYLKTKGTCSTSFIGHFFDKLLHLNVCTGNPYLDRELTRGHEELIQFLLAFDPQDPYATLGPIIKKFEDINRF